MLNKVCSSCGANINAGGNAFYKLCVKCNKSRLEALKKPKIKNNTFTQKEIKVFPMTLKTVKNFNCSTSTTKHEIINPLNVKSLTELFGIIWKQREHICCHCGCNLGEQSRVHYFSHIYPKSIRPWLKFDPNNIELLCIECHYQHDFGKRKTKLK